MTDLNGNTILTGLAAILGVLFWPGVIIWLIWFWVSRSKRRAGNNVTVIKPRLTVSDGLFNAHLTGGMSFIIVALIIALVAICERALYDITRTFVPDFNYFNNLHTILIQAAIILPLLVLSIFINVIIGRKKQRYALVLIPYFATSIILTVQLICQISVYFYNHHTTFQFYVVIVAVIVITSVAIHFIQNLYNKKIQAMKT